MRSNTAISEESDSLPEFIDLVDSHSARSLQKVRAPQLGLVAEDRVLCYRFLNGVLQEGLLLDLNSSMQVNLAFFVGTRYVVLNSTNPCRFDASGIIRRASVAWRGEGGRIPTLTQPSINPDQRCLVHVDTKFDRTRRTIYKEEFSSCIVTDGGVVAQSKGEMLLSLGQSESVEVFYADGSVKRLVCKDQAITAISLSIEEQAEARITHAVTEILAASMMPVGTEATVRTDRAFHQLVAVMAVGGKRSESVFEKAYGLLEEAGKAGMLARSVEGHAIRMLHDRPAHAVRLGNACMKKGSVHSVATNTPVSIQMNKPKGPPADRRAKLAARAERDRQQRQAARGSSADQSHKGSGKKSKK